jgi:hypothetical protein
VANYTCPNCGGTVTQDKGCNGCGAPYDSDVAALALFKRTVASLEAKKRSLHQEQLLLRTQLAHASAQRDSLARKVRQKDDTAAPPQRGLRSKITRRGARPTIEPEPTTVGTTGTPPTDRPAAARLRTAPPVAPQPAGTQPAGPPTGALPTAPPGGVKARPAGPPPRVGGLPPRIAARLPQILAGGVPGQRRVFKTPARSRPPVRGEGRVGGAETTTRTTQTVLLALGGLLLGGAAVFLAVVAFATVGTGGRIVLLTIVTPLTLALPVVLFRRRLIATAETVASVGLLLVLLDGYVAWSLGLFGAELLPTQVYFGVVCAVTAAVATAYRAVSHLVAPRYATVLVLQPVVPLVAYPYVKGSTGWALVFAAVAAMDLALAIGVSRAGGLAGFLGLPPLPTMPRIPRVRPAEPPAEPPTEGEAGAAEGEAAEAAEGELGAGPAEPPLDSNIVEPGATNVLRELTWILFTVAFGAALAYSATALGSTTTVGATLRAATVMVLTAALGVGGALAWRRDPLTHVAGGLATLAVVVSATRVGAVALPGHTLLFAALSVAVAALAVPVLPREARRGPGIASAIAAGVVAAMMLVRSFPAIGAPLRAATPVWHADLAKYPRELATAAGVAGWQMVIVGILLTVAAVLAIPKPARVESAIAASVLTVLVTPAGLGLSWAVTPAFLVTAAIVYGGLALAIRQPRAARTCLAAAALVGLFAAGASLSRSGATALVLAAITFAGTVIAAPRPARTDPESEAAAQQVSEAAAGGAAFALPGAVACGLAALIGERVLPGAGNQAILAGSFLAVSGTVGYAAMTQVARRRPSPPLLLGTTLGAGAVAIAALAAKPHAAIDIAVGVLLFGSALLLWLAPSLETRYLFGVRLEGPDVAAAAVTACVIAAVSRVFALSLPNAWLVVLAAVVLATALAVRLAPGALGNGPAVGTAAVGIVVAAIAGGSALSAGVGVIRAASPAWHANLNEWHHTAHLYAGYGWQAPIALLLVAAAAAMAVPEPYGDDIAAVCIGLATIGAAGGLGLDWWTPMVLGVAAAAGLGFAAVFSEQTRAAYTRIGVAGVVALFAAGASLVRAPATAGTLESLALVSTLIAGMAGLRLASARTVEARAAQVHLVPVGGGAAAAAVVTLAGATASFAAGEHRPLSVVLTAALAATSAALAIAGVLCWRLPGFLPFITVGVAVSGTAIALASLVDRHTAAVYAAAAALLGVLAELLRVASRRRVGWRPEDGWQPTRPAGGWRPDRVPVSSAWSSRRTWRPAARSRDFGVGALAASIVPAGIAVLILAPAVVTALVAPYHWVTRPWTGTPSTSVYLGQYARWTGTATDVIAGVALTLAGALAAVGLGGRAQAVADRAVAVAIPGLALTMLIAPGALHAPPPMYATVTLLVATICGLSLALTRPAPDTEAGDLLRFARRFVFVLAVLAAGAGGAGSLATRAATIEWLAGSIVVGLIGALWGKYPMARVIGWNVAASTAQLLALAVTLATGAPLRWAAFPVLGVAALLMALAGLLPRIRPTESSAYESTMIESTAYMGAAGAVGLTIGSPPRYTAAVLTALGAVLGLAASRPERSDRYRRTLIILGAFSEVVAVWLLMRQGQVALIEAYTLPFAVFALLVGLLELRVRPDLGSWLGYGPALVTGFLPTLVIVFVTDASMPRRVGLIVAAVLTVAIGSVRRLQAPVVIGGVVTAVATVHELFLFGRLLPWWLLLVLFTGAGVLLVVLGATTERLRRLTRLRGTVKKMR